MAKPRIFISSTFYDLQQIRLELDKFIESLGYEPIRNEEGDIPYDKEEKLEEYCYKEISNVDILVSIIGGRYGSQSSTDSGTASTYSITQREIITALENDKLVYLFIDKNVLTEYETYALNKGNNEVAYKYVDNVNIYKFIEEIKSRNRNNNIKAFETADDIKLYLREQFAGLFKQYILDAERMKEQRVISDINDTAKVLRGLVDYLKESKKGESEDLNKIIKVNHPLVAKLKALLAIPYNFYIEGVDDFKLLLNARKFRLSGKKGVWKHKENGDILQVNMALFDEKGKLKYIKADKWNDSWVVLTKAPNEQPAES